jgi:hypothetical protein
MKNKKIQNLSPNELPNHIQEYVKNGSEQTFRELFEATKENVDLRTDLTFQELVLINKIKMNDEFLFNTFNFKVYDKFLDNHLRLKISLERKSRGEYVDVNRRERFEQNLKKFGEFSNLIKEKN